MSPYNAKENLLKTDCQNEIKNKSQVLFYMKSEAYVCVNFLCTQINLRIIR